MHTITIRQGKGGRFISGQSPLDLPFINSGVNALAHFIYNYFNLVLSANYVGIALICFLSIHAACLVSWFSSRTCEYAGTHACVPL